MERKSWWKTGVALLVVVLGLAVAFVIVPSGGSNVSATEPAGPVAQVPTSTAIFAKYDGIDGEAVDKDHAKWIDVLSIDWGSRRFVSSSTRRTGSAFVNPVMLTLAYEKSAPRLTQALLTGRAIPKVEIVFTKTTYGGARATYLKYELTNVLITSYGFSGIAGGGLPTVVIGNNFEEIKVTYTEFKEDGNDEGSSLGYEYDAVGRIITK